MILRLLLLTSIATASVLAQTSATIVAPQVGSVSTTNVSVCWLVSEAADTALEVFADAGATVPLTDEVAVTMQNLQRHRRDVGSSAEGRANNRQLQQSMTQRRVVLAQVSGLQPDTSYWFRPVVRESGQVVSTGDLVEAKTATYPAFVIEARQLTIDLTPLVPIVGDVSGYVARVATANARYPLFAVVGDASSQSTAYVDLSHFLDTDGTTNLIPEAGSLQLVIDLIGDPDVPDIFRDDSVPYDGAPRVAQSATATILGLVISNATPGTASGLLSASVQVTDRIRVEENGSQRFEITLPVGSAAPASVTWYVADVPQAGTDSLTFDLTPDYDHVAHPADKLNVQLEAVVQDDLGRAVAVATWADVQIDDLDRLPSLPIVEIQPTLPLSDDDLTLVVVNQTPDPDGDPVSYQIMWSRDSQQPISGATLDAAETRAGDLWQALTRTVTNPYGATSVVSSLAVDASTLIGNTNPIAYGGAVDTGTDRSLIIDLQANDADNHSLTFVIATPAEHGSVQIDDALQGTALYTPHPDFSGTDQFAFIVTDSEGGASDPATVQIAVDGWRFALSSETYEPRIFGMRAAASDSIDAGIDVQVAQGAADWQWGIQLLGQTLQTDLRAPSSYASFLLYAEAAPGTSPLSVGWQPASIPPAGLFGRQLAEDGTPAAVGFSLATTNQLILTAGGERRLEIIYGTLEYDQRLNRGWNFLALPIQPVDPTPQANFGNGRHVVEWVGDDFYRPASELIAGRGYFVHNSDGPQTVRLRGVRRPESALPLAVGWNTVGPLADPDNDPLVPEAVYDSDVHPVIWRLTPDGYRQSRRLWPGFGHWVYRLPPEDIARSLAPLTAPSQ